MIEWLPRGVATSADGWTDVLREQRPAHYAAFESAVQEQVGAEGVRCFRSGGIYRLRRDGDSVVIERECPAPDALVDVELWPLFEWLIEAVGGDWNVEALRTTAAIYHIPMNLTHER